MKRTKLLIIGSGPAGYTAAIYAARANLAPILFEGFYTGPAGGQLMTTTEVENYPGFPEGITGPELIERFRTQALRFGTHVISEDIESVNFSHHPFSAKGSKTEAAADAVIIATGATAKRLDIRGARDGEFWQKGVTACAVCDGAAPIFRNRPLFVVGGGDTAIEEALFLTKFGSRVYIVHRRDQLRASKIMQERAFKNPKIEILWDSFIVAVEGVSIVRHVVIENIKTTKQETREAGGLFFAIGHTPNTAFLQGQIELHTTGYIKVFHGTRTSKEGIFAAGDVQDHEYRQAITAAGSGCMAALEAERWLAEKRVRIYLNKIYRTFILLDMSMTHKMWRFFTFFFLIGIDQASATEFQPWLGNLYELELRTSFIYQDYTWFSSGPHLKKYSSNDLFFNASLAGTLPAFGIEVEATQARTRRQKGNLDQLKVTGRYVWQDDIAGDPLSLTTGLSIIYALPYSLRDRSSFHHGRAEAELFLSIGKETPQEAVWISRWWSVLGLGIADRGSPWLRFHLSYEKRLWVQHEMRIFMHSLWGLGDKRLHLHHFHGYGPIQHQSVDVGLRYTYLLEYFGSASLEYSYRIHARNFPVYTHQVLAQLLYTFGLYSD